MGKKATLKPVIPVRLTDSDHCFCHGSDGCGGMCIQYHAWIASRGVRLGATNLVLMSKVWNACFISFQAVKNPKMDWGWLGGGRQHGELFLDEFVWHKPFPIDVCVGPGVPWVYFVLSFPILFHMGSFTLKSCFVSSFARFHNDKFKVPRHNHQLSWVRKLLWNQWCQWGSQIQIIVFVMVLMVVEGCVYSTMPK